MKVLITEWALESYLNLKHKRVFTVDEYKNKIRPDVEKLKSDLPFKDPKFNNDKFWSNARDRGKKVIPNAYKMKWHNVGDGKIQLRLLVFVHEKKIYLCQAYVKNHDSLDSREAAKLKIHIKKIYDGCIVIRGEL